MATIETEFSDDALMIDCETLALGPNAYLTQVGLCVANTKTHEYIIKPVNYWMSDVGQEQRVIDFHTVRWWFKQDPAVAAGVFEAPDGYKRVGLWQLFNAIEDIVKARPGLTVWASPAMSDLTWFKTLWGKTPWKYNQERDMMTLYKELDPNGELQPGINEKAHDAAADAWWQMEYLFRLKSRLEAYKHAWSTV